jgi:putative ABC transport system ATP-binding protein
VAFGGGVQAIGLDQGRVPDDPLEQERHQRHGELGRERGIHGVERGGVVGPERRVRPHAQQQHGGARVAAADDEVAQVAGHLLGGLPAEHVVAAEAHDHHVRVLPEEPVEPPDAAGRGVPADACVDDLHGVALGGERGPDERGERLVGGQAEPGGEAVAQEYDLGAPGDGRGGGDGRRRRSWGVGARQEEHPHAGDVARCVTERGCSGASLPLAVSLRHVSRHFRSGAAALTVLDDVSLEVTAGELVAIVGPSGSGKSTLLALLAGLDRPDAGEVWVDGEPLHTRTEDQLARWRRGALGFVFQSFQLLDHFTARENVQFPLELLGDPDPAGKADALLDAVGLGARGHHYPRQLSGGEQQRVAVARAFSASPRVLLADEPTGNLDGATGARVLDVMDTLRRRSGATLLLVTHDPGVAARADRRITLRDGRVQAP